MKLVSKFGLAQWWVCRLVGWVGGWVAEWRVGGLVGWVGGWRRGGGGRDGWGGEGDYIPIATLSPPERLLH